MTVEVGDNAREGRYELREDGELVGFVTYRLGEGRITLVHTEIDPSHADRGLGSQLARGALDDAKRRGLTVVPRCSFIARFIREHAEQYLPLVQPSLRERVLDAD
jgi:predicted GNAT family acetyltransferase